MDFIITLPKIDFINYPSVLHDHLFSSMAIFRDHSNRTCSFNFYYTDKIDIVQSYLFLAFNHPPHVHNYEHCAKGMCCNFQP